MLDIGELRRYVGAMKRIRPYPTLFNLARFFTAAAVIFAALLSLMLTTARAAELHYEEFTLGNGMRFVLIPQPEAPAVMWSLWYGAGSADEVEGKTGLAHFLEHLMFKGTEAHGPGEFSKRLERDGAIINAHTTREYTVYHVRMLKNLLPEVMELEADRMRNLVIDEALMETERLVIKEERRERLENDPAMLLVEEMDAAVYPNHPYGRPPIGHMSEVEELTAADAIAFYERYYHPDNAVAVVAGDLDLAELKTLAQEYFDGLTASPQKIERSVSPAPGKPSQQRILRVNPSARWPFVIRQYAAPTFTSAKEREAFALDFLADILAGGTQGLLFQELVVKQRVASDVTAGYIGGGPQGGRFSITVSLNTATGTAPNTQAVEAAIDKMLSEIAANGVSRELLASSLQKSRVARAYSLDRQSGLVMWIGGGLMSGWNMQDYYSLKPWDAVTPDDVRDAARQFLSPAQGVTGVLLREEGAQP